jgi:hypothetical protein
MSASGPAPVATAAAPTTRAPLFGAERKLCPASLDPLHASTSSSAAAEEDRIEVESVRPRPPPMMPYHHRSNQLNSDTPPEFQTTTLTRGRAPGGLYPPPSTSASGPTSSEIDLHHLHHASVHVGPGHHRQHELRRPDSVITTSSLVSSDTASQTGDSTEVGLHCPPNVYTISGLYGPGGGGGSGSGGSGVAVSSSSKPNKVAITSEPPITPCSDAAATASIAAFDAHLMASSSAASKHPAAAVPACCKMTHRRQASHPGHFTDPQAPVSVWPLSTDSSTTTTAVKAPGSLCRTASGHRRSNSYGQQHRALTGTNSCGGGGGAHYGVSHHVPHHHRRTASSVIETLQTLTCSGSGGDGTSVDKREESIAQFLENLKKEQQEK